MHLCDNDEFWNVDSHTYKFVCQLILFIMNTQKYYLYLKNDFY